MDLQTPIQNANSVYKLYQRRLERLGIGKLEDFLYHMPSRYEDYSIISKISQAQPGEIVTIQGTVLEIKNNYLRSYKTLQKAKITDEKGELNITWFNQPYLIKTIVPGSLISISGKVDVFAKKMVMQSPEFEILEEGKKTIHTGRLVPIYPETKGISSKWLRRQIYKILTGYKDEISEYIPDFIREQNSFPKISDAFWQVHFPDSLETAYLARHRLSFDELFLLQLSALKKRAEWEKKLEGHPFSISKYKKEIQNFWDRLPFELTRAQKRAVQDIFRDLASKKPMNRLLEGDVGSGKTVVSAIAMFLAHLNGFQSVLMAPTQILASQHFQTISNLLSPFGVDVKLVTGESKLKMKSEKLKVLIGTHAVLSKNIEFERLGLVVIDEQQRFGVEQRALIKSKGKNPHLLTMTATPIPRTVALTLYGDLDLSYLDEMPKGRKIVKTWLVVPAKREPAYIWIQKHLKQTDSQAFIICPFIEESESMITVKAATKEFERLKKEVFPNLKLGLLHGKLKAKEKTKVLEDFRNRTFEILVATPVVEVGIDIPNATIMVIEASERFGLSQLHQLRGRVGRGEKQSYCLLFTESRSEQTMKRLKAMETLYIGAELAELDLKLRGPGDLYGTMQHGMKRLKVANFSDRPLIELVHQEVAKIFPKLSSYPKLLKRLEEISISHVSPD